MAYIQEQYVATWVLLTVEQRLPSVEIKKVALSNWTKRAFCRDVVPSEHH